VGVRTVKKPRTPCLSIHRFTAFAFIFAVTCFRSAAQLSIPITGLGTNDLSRASLVDHQGETFIVLPSAVHRLLALQTSNILHPNSHTSHDSHPIRRQPLADRLHLHPRPSPRRRPPNRSHQNRRRSRQLHPRLHHPRSLRSIRHRPSRCHRAQDES